MLNKSNLILPLSSISNDDKELVGEKASSLGEMIKHGFPLPDGFVITQNAYRQFALKHNLPDKLIKEIFRAYKRLESPLKDAAVEIFQFMVVKGEAVLIEKIKSIWSRNSSAIVVRKIPQTSYFGVMFTINPTHNDKTKIVIKEGKTENHYEVSKKDLNITSKIINKGKVQMLTDKQLINVAEWGKKLQEYCYFPQEVRFAVEKNNIYITKTKPITTLGIVIPAILRQAQDGEHRRTKAGMQELTRFVPVKTGIKSGMTKMRNMNNLSTKKPKHSILLRGRMLYSGIATGHLRVIQSTQDINKILRGEIIVIPYLDLIKHPLIKAGAIVATEDRFRHVPHPTLGPFFSGKPTIVTSRTAINVLKNGAVVTVNGKSGEVFAGSN